MTGEINVSIVIVLRIIISWFLLAFAICKQPILNKVSNKNEKIIYLMVLYRDLSNNVDSNDLTL